MVTYDATTVKNRFGEVIEAARQEPVCVTKSGKSVVFMLSSAEFARLQKLEDAYWSQRIRDAEKTGYVGQEKSMELVKKLMGQADEKPSE